MLKSSAALMWTTCKEGSMCGVGLGGGEDKEGKT